MAGNAIDPTAFEPRVTVPEPCAVEDCLAPVCEALHGRGECLTFLASGDPIPRAWADTPVAPVPLPLPAALPLLLVAVVALAVKSREGK